MSKRELDQRVETDIPTGQGFVRISVSSFDSLLEKMEAIVQEDQGSTSKIRFANNDKYQTIMIINFFFFFSNSLHLRVTCCPPTSRGTCRRSWRDRSHPSHALSQTRVCNFCSHSLCTRMIHFLMFFPQFVSVCLHLPHQESSSPHFQ